MSLLSRLPLQGDDPILALMGLFRDDPREGKIDLGVGVYRDAEGRTPVMGAVTAAERRILERQATKGYTGLAGDPGFTDAMRALILGGAVDPARVAAVATPGGTGAVRQGMEAARMAGGARVWLPDPSWPNHAAILGHVGLEGRRYRYHDAATGGVAFEAMLADLGETGAGDLVVLHGCCHNPTGADPTGPQWDAVAAVLAGTGATPLVDLAYQGFGEGVERDVAGLRRLVARVPEAMVAASGSKSFGLYRERVGVLLAVSDDRGGRVQGALATLNRLAYSFPPDHGARVVETILRDDGLRRDWLAELDAMRGRIEGVRRLLADALRERTGSDRLGFLAGHRGMFSRLPATREQVEALRRDHAVYLVGDGRMNVAGLDAAAVPRLADAVAAVGV